MTAFVLQPPLSTFHADVRPAKPTLIIIWTFRGKRLVIPNLDSKIGEHLLTGAHYIEGLFLFCDPLLGRLGIVTSEAVEMLTDLGV